MQPKAIAEVDLFSKSFDKEFPLITCHSCTSTDVDEIFIEEIDRELSLISCHSLSASPTSMWYIDSGASNHMTSARNHFTYLNKTGLDL